MNNWMVTVVVRALRWADNCSILTGPKLCSCCMRSTLGRWSKQAVLEGHYLSIRLPFADKRKVNCVSRDAGSFAGLSYRLLAASLPWLWERRWGRLLGSDIGGWSRPPVLESLWTSSNQPRSDKTEPRQTSCGLGVEKRHLETSAGLSSVIYRKSKCF